MSTNRYLSARAVAERYDIGLATVWRWTKRGNLPQPRKLSPGCTRWSAAELEQYDRGREAEVQAST